MKSVLTVLALCALLSLVLSASIIDLEDEKQPLGTRKHKFVPYPKKIVGLYILLADEEKEGHENNATKWTPELYEWQQQAANVLFFTFIKPDDEFIVPKSFKDLAATRGTGAKGAVPADTVILFALGGYLYSINTNPWPFLTSKAAAEAKAEEIAQWPDLYGCDGIDLDIETGAGNTVESGENMVHFLTKLKSLQPNMIVNQPVFGYPDVKAENAVVNHSWGKNSEYLGLANSIGIMAYEGTSSLNYVKNYADASSQWEGFPIQVDVPRPVIQLGCKGGASGGTITALANAAVSQDLMGIMVWYSSVVNGFQYAKGFDANSNPSSPPAYVEARRILGA